jgi:hypothetical protein
MNWSGSPPSTTTGMMPNAVGSNAAMSSTNPPRWQ